MGGNRYQRTLRGLVAGITLLLAGCGGGGDSITPGPPGGSTPPPGLGNANVLTYHNDNARTGANSRETVLTPANVNSADFGRINFFPVDGKVDAQPLYVSALGINGTTRNMLYVVTEHDSVYAFNADSGAVLWRVPLLGAGETPSDDRGCSQVTPEIGVTATPVIDPAAGPHGTLFVVAMSKDGTGGYYQRLHTLDLATGAERPGSPVTVRASYPGTGDNSVRGRVIFAPAQYKERPGLLLLNGVVYTFWSSHCDYRPYTGWIIGYNESTLTRSRVLDITPNGSEGSIWASGAGPAADSGGNIYFLAGNGTFATTLDANGFPIHHDYGNAFLKISTANHKLAVADYFTMDNTVAESSADEDFGSGGALVLPDFTDANGQVRRLAVGAGKDRNIYVVNPGQHGKIQPHCQPYLAGTAPRLRWSGIRYAGLLQRHAVLRRRRRRDPRFQHPPGETLSHTGVGNHQPIPLSGCHTQHLRRRQPQRHPLGRGQQQPGGAVFL